MTTADCFHSIHSKGFTSLQYGFELAAYGAFIRAYSIYVGEFYCTWQIDPRTKPEDEDGRFI